MFEDLLRAIAASREEEAPYLALAAWLEGEGRDGARGAFIRTQVALEHARVDADDLRATERRLLAENLTAWLGPLGGLAPHMVQFRRGLLTGLSVYTSRAPIPEDQKQHTVAPAV